MAILCRSILNTLNHMICKLMSIRKHPSHEVPVQGS
jgi:hypothetical protein